MDNSSSNFKNVRKLSNFMKNVLEINKISDIFLRTRQISRKVSKFSSFIWIKQNYRQFFPRRFLDNVFHSWEKSKLITIPNCFFSGTLLGSLSWKKLFHSRFLRAKNFSKFIILLIRKYENENCKLHWTQLQTRFLSNISKVNPSKPQNLTSSLTRINSTRTIMRLKWWQIGVNRNFVRNTNESYLMVVYTRSGIH